MNNADDNDDDNETARRATPSPSITNPDLAGENSSRQDVHRVPQPSTRIVGRAKLPLARVEGRVYLHSLVPGIAQVLATSPSAHTLDLHPPDCSSRIIKGQVPVVLPTYTWPIHKSTCVTSIDVDPDCFTTPAPARNSREAGSNIDSS